MTHEMQAGGLAMAGGSLATTIDTLETPVVVESFEGTDPLAAYTGDTGLFSVVDAANLNVAAKDGTYVLASNDGTTGEIYTAHADGTLSQYFHKGHRAHVWVCYSNTPNYEIRVNFGYESPSENYLIRIIPGTSSFEAGSETSSGYTAFGNPSLSQSLATETWYRIEITWDDGTLGGQNNEITVRLLTEDGTELAAVNGVNADHAEQGGIAFRSWNSGTGDRIFWDDFRIVE